MSIRESIQSAANLLVKVHDADLKTALQQALLQAQGDALDLQDRLANLQDENAKLRKQVDEMTHAASLEEDVYFARNVYWRKSETAFTAYCPTCWGVDRVMVHLQPGYDHNGLGGNCPNCRQG